MAVVISRLKKLRTAILGMVTGKAATGCPLLWDSVFINLDGSVYTCCHSLPFKIGNIYKQSLEAIWSKSVLLRFARFLSRSNRLYCGYSCTIVSSEQKKQSRYQARTYPRTVWILFSELCNISCIMCVQNHRNRKVLDTSVLRSHIDWGRIDEVEFQGGEILALPEAKEFYKWVYTSTGKKINLITNGTLIDEEWAGHLVRGSGWIEISINAATKKTHERVNRKSKFERVIENVKLLAGAKKKAGSAVRIIFKFTIVPENIMEVPDAIPLAEAIGCDEIAFGYSREVAGWLEKNESSKRLLIQRIAEAVAAKKNLGMDALRLVYLGLLQ